MNRLLALSIILYCFINISNGQDNTRPIIEQYHSDDYKASASNYDISSSLLGELFFANFDGLLEFDGINWKVNLISDGKLVSAVHTTSQNEIYIGSDNEFGFFDSTLEGIKKYTSLSENNSAFNFGRIRQIISTKDKVFFISRNYIFEYFEKQLKSWHINDNAILSSFILDNKLHLLLSDQEVYRINKAGIIKKTTIFKLDQKVIFAKALDRNNLLILTDKNKTYVNSRDSLMEISIFPEYFNDHLAQIKVRDIILDTIKNDLLGIISTRENGVYLTTPSQIHSHISTENGLSDNNIRGIKLINNDLWIITQNGINSIKGFKSWSHWNKNHGLNGVIFDVKRVNGNLLVATGSAGIFELKENIISQLNKKNEGFSKFFKIENKNFANSFEGIYCIDDEGLMKMLTLDLPTETAIINDSTILVVTRNGIKRAFVFEKKLILDKKFTNEIGGISFNSVKYNKSIWFSIKSSGILRIDSNSHMFKFNIQHGLPDNRNLYIFTHNNSIKVASGNGFYKLNSKSKKDSSDFFIRDTEIADINYGISNISIDDKENIWLSADYGQFNRRIEKLELNEDNSYDKIGTPFKFLPTQEYSVIYPDPDQEGIIWIAGTEGLYRYDDKIEVDYDIPFNTLIRKVYTGDSLIFGGTYYNPSDTSMVQSIVLDQPEEFKPTLTFDYNELRFTFTATSYEVPEKNEFSYYLKGYDKVWSEWNTENKKEYTNLDPGTYVFMVKSKNIYDTEGRTATYEFTILPPWYMTTWGYGLFAFLGVLSVIGIIRVYTYRLRLQRQKLKLIVADRTYEVLKQKKEIEEQHEKLLEQTEEIKQQHDDIQRKNEELETSQRKLKATNIELEGLNETLEKKVIDRTKKIKTTLEQLQKTNKELDTFIYRASHDLKSPISRIVGLTSLARLELPDDGSQEYMELIDLAANDMKNLLAKLTKVHELLNKKIVKTEIDVPSLLGGVRESLKHIDQKNNTKYSFKIKESLSIRSDEDIVHVIIENLLENALIFRKENNTEQHHIQIKVFEDDGTINIALRDNGVGIPYDLHHELFDMFYRASDKSKGTGLGLYLVKMAVDKLNGTIKVQSEPGEFTEFTVSIPSS